MEKGLAELIDDVFASIEDRQMAKRWLHVAQNKPKALEVTITTDLDKMILTENDEDGEKDIKEE